MLQQEGHSTRFDPDHVPALVIDRFLAFISNKQDSRDDLLRLSQTNRAWRSDLMRADRNDAFYLPLLKIETPFADELMDLQHVWHKQHGTSYRDMYLLATCRRQARMVLLDTQPGQENATLRCLRDPEATLPWFPIPQVARSMTEIGGFLYITRLFEDFVYVYGGQRPLASDDPRGVPHNGFKRVMPGGRFFRFAHPVGTAKGMMDLARGTKVGVCPVYQTKDANGRWMHTGFAVFDIGDVFGSGFQYIPDLPPTGLIVGSFMSHYANQFREGMEDRDVGRVGRRTMCYVTKDGKWLVETDDGTRSTEGGSFDKSAVKPTVVERAPNHFVVKSAFGDVTSGVALIPLSPQHALLS